MNQKETVYLVEQYQKGDRAVKSKASNKLWKIYQDWVEAIVGANAKKRRGVNKTEMLSEACVGFMKALEHYDLNKANECSLKSYAAFWINGALINYKKVQIHNGYVVPRCPAAVRTELFIASNDRNSISNASLQNIASTYEIPVKRVKELEMFFCSSENVSFDKWETKKDSDIQYPFGSNYHAIDAKKVLNVIHSFVRKQKEPISVVLHSRWLADKRTPLKTLAKRFGQSYESIRQIEIGAYNSLIIELKRLAII
ncbi:MAG: hypothetical protein COA86_02265 [Kangiella sp.]|nr:MAG: hypothetical protein COA86_02265 [Kangiella sp.]